MMMGGRARECGTITDRIAYLAPIGAQSGDTLRVTVPLDPSGCAMANVTEYSLMSVCCSRGPTQA